jgi:uncharacterized membrane protein YadS
MNVVKTVQSAVLAMAMVGLGFGIQIRALREVGLRPVLLGLISTVIRLADRTGRCADHR